MLNRKKKIIKFIKNNFPLIIILLLSFSTRFFLLAYPSEIIFDEVHFGKFVNAYFSHKYYFDIHPPLGKLMIAGFAGMFGYKGKISFEKIGAQADSKSLFVLRFLPAFFSALFPLIIYFLLKELGISARNSLLGALLVIFENGILTHSKFILIDIFLLFFGFVALYFYLKHKKEKNEKIKRLFLVLAFFFSAMAFSIKWTGLSFIGLILVDILFAFFKKRKRFLQFCLEIIVFFFVFLFVYYFIFLIHFKIVYKSGSGDAFMSSAFQRTLLNNKVLNKDIKPLADWQKFIELNKKMYIYNSRITSEHSYTSRWYEWPWAVKPIWYWAGSVENKKANIYLFGNFIIWFAIIPMIIYIFYLIKNKEKRKKVPPFFWLFFLGYFANLLPYILIRRATFIYHYFPSLIFGILMLVVLYEKIISPCLEKQGLKKLDKFMYIGFLSLVFLNFLFLFPINYGLLIPSKLSDFYNFLISYFFF